MADVGPDSTTDVFVVWHPPGFSSSTPDTGRLLRGEVARALNVSADAVHVARSCPGCGSSAHGRPVVRPVAGVAGVSVSLARAGGLVVVAVALLDEPRGGVGVDVEHLDAVGFPGFDHVALHPRESATTLRARATTWVRKESLLKATGYGLHLDPTQVRLTDPDEQPSLLEWDVDHPLATSVWMRDLDIPSHAACLTLLGAQQPRITVRRAGPEDLPR